MLYNLLLFVDHLKRYECLDRYENRRKAVIGYIDRYGMQSWIMPTIEETETIEVISRAAQKPTTPA